MTKAAQKPAAFLKPNLDRFSALALALAMLAIAAMSLWTTPLAAQDLETFDPDAAFAQSAADAPNPTAIDADLVAADTNAADALPVAKPLPEGEPSRSFEDELEIYREPPVEGAAPSPDAPPVAQAAGGATNPAAQTATAASNTYAEDDLIGAAEGVFGKGAKGIAKMIEGLLAKEGQPNGYIVGREAGGAFIFGARYGSGTLHHKVEGERKVYWNGPSVGFDAGANAANTFVLVYNLWDSEDLFKRYPAGEGQAYLVGGLHASYVRRGDVVLIPIRMGTGLRLGVNAGYMKFSKKQRWLPF
ncbi:MAG: DUF1134 domain-containing protein [Pseudomonadota bacterium]